MKEMNTKSEFPALLKPITIGCSLGAVVTFMMLLLFALALTLQDMPSMTITIMSSIAAGIGALVAGFASSRILGKRGLMTGFLSGTVLFLFVLVISMCLSGSSFSVYSLIKLVIMLICSSTGGIMGVNMKQKRKFI